MQPMHWYDYVLLAAGVIGLVIGILTDVFDDDPQERG